MVILVLKNIMHVVHEETKVTPSYNPEETVYDEDAEVQVIAPNFRISNDEKQEPQ